MASWYGLRTSIHRLLVSTAAVFPAIAFIVAICAIGAFSNSVLAAAASPRQEPPLRLATKPIPPFVIEDKNGDLSGFSIDLWGAIAAQLQRPYAWERVGTVKEQLAAVEAGEADAAIAAITITEEREQHVDFSFPYFESGLGILTPAKSEMPVLDAIALAFSPALLRLLAFVLALLIIVGHLVWLFERKHNPEFPRDYIHGVWAGMWYAGVTVTTVGYGDKTPRSIPGRIVGLVWMFAGLFVIANFTAGVTAQLALRELKGAINGPQDLPGKRVLAVEGTTGAAWLTGQGIPHITVKTIDDAYPELAGGGADAIVYDYPVLLYYSLNDGEHKTQMAGGPFDLENYGIAVPTSSALREDINRALLKLHENGMYKEIYTRWFGADANQ
jgi:polar amino acid transport system substrate-binding protein